MGEGYSIIVRYAQCVWCDFDSDGYEETEMFRGISIEGVDGMI